ncbi:hypothetical protein HQ560_09790 [bacterium]|nr:hypothetical protein [bacterium]
MDYSAVIERVYDHVESDHVDKAVMACLRIARHLQDYLYTAIFLREMGPGRREMGSVFFDDTKHLQDEARKFLWERSLEYWLEIHTLDYNIGSNDDGEERNVLNVPVGELDRDIDQCELWIRDMDVPTGLSEYDTAAFIDRHVEGKGQFRLRLRAIETIKQRIRTRCLNYATRIERQLQAQAKSESVFAQMQNDVDNYFNAHSRDVYDKLQKAAQLLDSTDPEDRSLLLTEVRRAIKAAADFFYPPGSEQVTCADGKTRVLDDEKYLNRLEEYLMTKFTKSSSRDLSRAELGPLAVFARKLSGAASKGVHADVSIHEAKQGLLV